jgi:uncharacterized membrane protein
LVLQGETSSKILTLRSKQVILDRDLVELYHVETKVLKMELERKNDKQFKEVFKKLDNLVKIHRKQMRRLWGFIKPENDL